MKFTKQQKEEASKPSTKSAAGFKKSTNSSTAQHPNVKRCGEQLIGAKEKLHKKYGDSQEQGCSSLDKVAAPIEADKLPSFGHEHRAIPFSSAKIKLQLFPLDEGIRIGLEQDGYNPHLELTLSARKKISSVLKHVSNKWGCSNVALGEPALFPFKINLESLAAYRCWTLKDSSISAGDVHAAVGYPSVFRLRYGWFSTQQKNTLIPSVTSSLACTQSDALLEGCNVLEASNPTKVVSKQLEPVNVVEQPTIGAVEQLPPAGPSNTEGLENTVSHASSLWFDSMSNISIGALLSEESLLGKCSMLYPKSNEGTSVSQPAQLLAADSMDAFVSNHLKSAQDPAENGSGFQPSPAVADSFDAFIANHQKNAQEQKSSKEELQPSQLVPDSFDASIANYLRNTRETRNLSVPSSILDAEETCHSFAFMKSYSSNKEFLGDGRSYFSALSTPDPELKSHNSSKASAEGSYKQDGIPDHKPEPETQPLKGFFNDENSLGFSKINWTDSMGPFDLSLSSQQMMKGDSISLSEFVR